MCCAPWLDSAGLRNFPERNVASEQTIISANLIFFSPGQKEAIFVDTEQQPLTRVGLLQNERNQASEISTSAQDESQNTSIPGVKCTCEASSGSPQPAMP